MKAQSLLPISALFSVILLFQSCAINSTLIDTQQITVTHEHRVELPAAMYTPGTSNLPMFEKKGDVSLAVSMTNSGKNTNNDSNPEGDPTKVSGKTTHQTISKTRTYTVNAGYALTDEIGLTASFTTGKDREEYRPYIESWNLTQDVYSTEYWVGFPLTWDNWVQGSWQSNNQIQTINDYQKVSKNIVRSYKYYDGELAIGKYKKHNNLKTGMYGGLGFAKNEFKGHLTRNYHRDIYSQHDASFFKLFVLPSAAYSQGWIELGAAVKGSFLRYNLKSMENNDRQYSAEVKNIFFVEPTVFLRIGPKAFRVQVEQKWLKGLGKSPFSTNNSFTSVGVISMLSMR